jgi:hypothetical protein
MTNLKQFSNLFNFQGAEQQKQVNRFISSLDPIFSKRLMSEINFPRVVALMEFNLLLHTLEIASQKTVGVVSGSEQEPELKLLNYEKINLLNFSDDQNYDLDVCWGAQESLDHDLTMCNQVFEHIFSPHIAFGNLVHHTKPGGFIWITIPTVNCIHSDPYFFSSGYHPRFLARLGHENNCDVVHVGHWGSLKYLLSAVRGKWLTYDQLGIGLHSTSDFYSPPLIFVDGRKNSSHFITDCWALFRVNK